MSYWADDHEKTNNTVSFGAQLGARVQFVPGVLLHVIAEDNINKFYASQFRLYAVLDISLIAGSNGFATRPPRGVGPSMGQYGAGYGTGMGY